MQRKKGKKKPSTDKSKPKKNDSRNQTSILIDNIYNYSWHFWSSKHSKWYLPFRFYPYLKLIEKSRIQPDKNTIDLIEKLYIHKINIKFPWSTHKSGSSRLILHSISLAHNNTEHKSSNSRKNIIPQKKPRFSILIENSHLIASKKYKWKSNSENREKVLKK